MQRLRQAQIRGRVARIDGQRASITFNSLIVLALSRQHDTLQVRPCQVFRIQQRRTLIKIERRPELTVGLEQHRQTPVCGGIFGVFEKSLLCILNQRLCRWREGCTVDIRNLR